MILHFARLSVKLTADKESKAPNARSIDVRSTPKRAGSEPIPGSRFLADVLADNIHAYRSKARMNQSDLAERMGWLKFPWSRATVSDVERSGRNISTDEIFALALVLETTIPALLDPTGIDGRGRESLDYGFAKPMEADHASKFVRGEVQFSVTDDRALAMEPGTSLKAAFEVLADRLGTTEGEDQ